MSETIRILIALLDAAEELEQVLGAEWPQFRDRLASAAARLESSEEPALLRVEVDALLAELIRSPAADLARSALRQIAPAGPPPAPRKRGRTFGPEAAARGGPSRPPQEEPAGSIVIPVFYGTDRARTGEEDAARFFGGDRGELSFGVAQVSIPVTAHEKGQLEGPSWWKLQFRPDPEKHIVLLEVQPQDRQAFLDELRGALASADQRDALIFVHGYNVGFADAARRAAQVSRDLQFPGRTLLYSWPSMDRTLRYAVDEATVEWSVPHFAEFLRMVLAETGAQAVHVIAHSMGNRALMRVLERFDTSTLPAHAATLRQIIFAAPDIDSDVFGQLAAAFHGRAQRYTLYASSNDLALRISRLLHRYPRAGDTGRKLMIVEGVDTIDASQAGTSLMGHSYYGSERSILNDILTLIGAGSAPDDRSDLSRAHSTAGKYWVYRA